MDNNISSIIEGCLKKDRASQQKLYQLYYAYGMSICIRYVKDEDEAVLVLNDSFLKVFNRIKKYNPDRPFKPWFRIVVVNTAIDYVKRKRKLEMNVELNEAQNATTREDILSRIGYKELIAMVQSLSLAYRTVFNMYVIDGFKHEEIAKTLGVSVGTSKSNLSKARARLQEMVAESLNEKVG